PGKSIPPAKDAAGPDAPAVAGRKFLAPFVVVFDVADDWGLIEMLRQLLPDETGVFVGIRKRIAATPDQARRPVGAIHHVGNQFEGALVVEKLHILSQHV